MCGERAWTACVRAGLGFLHGLLGTCISMGAGCLEAGVHTLWCSGSSVWPLLYQSAMRACLQRVDSGCQGIPAHDVPSHNWQTGQT